jgi:hypothetical protein
MTKTVIKLLILLSDENLISLGTLRNISKSMIKRIGIMLIKKFEWNKNFSDIDAKVGSSQNKVLKS